MFKKFNTIGYIYLISIANKIFDNFIIYSAILSRHNLEFKDITNIFAFDFTVQATFAIISGIFFDKHGQRSFLYLLNTIKIISYILLLYTFYDIKYLYTYIFIKSSSDGFALGKTEAMIYGQSENNQNYNYTKLVLSYFFLYDFISIISSITTGILVSKSQELIPLILFISILIRFGIFYIIKNAKIKDPKYKISSTNILLTKVRYIMNNKSIMFQILYFAIFISNMYTYKEMLILLSSLSDSGNKISLYKSIYHICITSGSIIPIFFGNKLLLKSSIYIHRFYTPSIFFAMLYTAIFNNHAYLIYIIITFVPLAFGLFQTSVEKSLNAQLSNIGYLNSILWIMVLLLASFNSIILNLVTKISNPENAITLTFLVQFVLLIKFGKSINIKKV